MPEDQIKIAVLEQRVEDLKEFVLKVDDAIEKISQVNVNLTKMLAVHEEKLDAREKSEKTLNQKIDDIYSRMQKDHSNVLEEIKKVNFTLEKVETNLDNRLVKVEADQTKINLKLAIVVAGATFLAFMIQNSGFFVRIFSDGHLTNHQTPAKVEGRSR
jgi:chromosome segregation ATPase